MLKEKSTQELLNALSSAKNLELFLEENQQYFRHSHLADFLMSYIEKKGLKRGDVIKASQLGEVYAYQILNGIKYPKRDKVICLLFAMGADLEESQTLLKGCGYANLYAKNERDCVLIFAFNNGLSVAETQNKLDKAGLALLNV